MRLYFTSPLDLSRLQGLFESLLLRQRLHQFCALANIMRWDYIIAHGCRCTHIHVEIIYQLMQSVQSGGHKTCYMFSVEAQDSTDCAHKLPWDSFCNESVPVAAHTSLAKWPISFLQHQILGHGSRSFLCSGLRKLHKRWLATLRGRQGPRSPAHPFLRKWND